jgi:hypothetical protein
LLKKAKDLGSAESIELLKLMGELWLIYYY